MESPPDGLELISRAESRPGKFVVVGGFQRTGTNYLRNLVLSVMEDRADLVPITSHSFSEFAVRDGFLHSPRLVYLFTVRPIKKLLASLIVLSNKEDSDPEEVATFFKRQRYFFSLFSYLDLAINPLKNTIPISLESLGSGGDEIVKKILLDNGVSVIDPRYSSMEILDANQAIATDIRSNTVPMFNEQKLLALEKAHAILESRFFAGLIEELSQKYDQAIGAMEARSMQLK